jgi:hypothetical protein
MGVSFNTALKLRTTVDLGCGEKIEDGISDWLERIRRQRASFWYLSVAQLLKNTTPPKQDLASICSGVSQLINEAGFYFAPSLYTRV